MSKWYTKGEGLGPRGEASPDKTLYCTPYPIPPRGSSHGELRISAHGFLGMFIAPTLSSYTS